MNPIILQQTTRSPKCDEYWAGTPESNTTMTKEECLTCYDPFGVDSDMGKILANIGKEVCWGRAYNDHQCRRWSMNGEHSPFKDQFLADGTKNPQYVPRTKESSILVCPDVVACQKQVNGEWYNENSNPTGGLEYGKCEDQGYNPSDKKQGRKYVEDYWGGYKKLFITNSAGEKQFKCTRTIPCYLGANDIRSEAVLQECADNTEYPYGPCVDACYDPSDAAAGRRYNDNNDKLGLLPGSFSTYKCPRTVKCRHDVSSAAVTECMRQAGGSVVISEASASATSRDMENPPASLDSILDAESLQNANDPVVPVESTTPSDAIAVPTSEPQNQNVNCLGNWGDFGECTNGTKHKFWVITQEKQGEGLDCTDEEGNTLTSSSTKSESCPVNCAGSYGDWGECVDGRQSKRFNITTSAANGGDECTEASIMEQDCAMDCVGSWSGYGACDVDSGTHSKTYTVTRAAMNGGAACTDEGSEVTNGQVKTESCEVDCLGEWGSFGACDAQTGTHSKTYTVARPAMNGGATCKNEDGSEATDGQVKTENCAVDCSGNYTEWSECNAATGTRTRSYNIDITQKNGGKDCQNTEDTSMNCKVECVGTWGEWGECNRDSLPLPGYQFRTFAVSRAGLNLGEGEGCDADDGAIETKACAMECIGAFGEYGECDATTGKKTRRWEVKQPALNNGTCVLEGTEEQEDCPVNCVGSFGEWSACSAEGKKTRSFIVSKPEMNGGLCENKDKTEEEACPVSCQGSFGEWTACNTQTGKRSKTFTVSRNAINNGASCTDSTVKDDEDNLISLTNGYAVEENCAVACVGGWGEWGECDGNNVKTRTFNVTTSAKPGKNGEMGPSCKIGDTVMNDGDTETMNCPVVCQGSFGEFGQCINGQKQRTYNITQIALNSGTECPHADGHIDYDGTDCPDTTKGQACTTNDDCVSGTCENGFCYAKNVNSEFCLKPNSRLTMSGCQCEGECTAGKSGHWCFTTEICNKAGPMMDNGKSWDYCSYQAVDAGECNTCIKGYKPETVEHSSITGSGCECISDCTDGNTGWWCDTKPGCVSGGSGFVPMTYGNNQSWDYCNPKITQCVKGDIGTKTAGQSCTADSDCTSGMCADNNICFQGYELEGGKIKPSGKFGKGYFDNCSAANSTSSAYPGHCNH